MTFPTTSIELTVRGRVVAWLAALAAGAAWLGGDANARLAAAMLTAPLVIDFVHKRRGLHHTTIRVGARRTAAGVGYTETLTIVHQGRGTLRDCLLTEQRTMRSEQPALLPPLAPVQPARVPVRQRSMQRGHVLERVFLLLAQSPLGMFRSRAAIHVAADLVTEPARVSLRSDVLRSIDESEMAPHDRSHLSGPEFHSLREHHAGEDARAVHALRSASLGTLVRTVTHGRLPRTIGIVLDLRRPPRRELHHGSRRFEWGLGACATLLHVLRHRGAEAHVLVLGDQPASILVQGPAHEAELMMMLAAASPSPCRSVQGELFATIQKLEHCLWIPAGAYFESPEFAAMPGKVTLVGGDDE